MTIWLVHILVYHRLNDKSELVDIGNCHNLVQTYYPQVYMLDICSKKSVLLTNNEIFNSGCVEIGFITKLKQSLQYTCYCLTFKIESLVVIADT